ncbi:MAG TPA: hypothetical protein PKE31_12780 [Pseudomonadota bacterium]|nr:hypothetical protein [Pseudomonadota bacterium]
MMTTVRLFGFVCLLGGLSMLASCKQGEGERCQLDEDCTEGLYCELAGNTRAQGGFCKLLNSSSTVIDLSVPQDLSKPADLTQKD